MTKREWKPGDVAALHYSFADAGRAIRVSGCKGHGSCDHWHFANGNHGTGDGASEIRPLVVIDPEDREQVERLYRAIYRAFGDDPSDYSPDDERDMQAALREFADPKPPRCVAHGNEACADCSRIRTIDFDGGECRHCSTYGTDGMHWDTCPGRIRGPVFANRAEAMGAKS
jgi:hypothetical protein